MKTTFIYSAVLAFIFSAFLSSCSFLQKEEFAQRKYYNFPRTNHQSEGKQSEFVAVKKEKIVTEKVTAKEESISPEVTATASSDKNAASSSSIKEKLNPSEKKASHHIARNILKEETRIAPLKKIELLKRAIKKASQPASDSDLMLILLLILAIIIPPLAVFLKNEGLSKWFWITLILCIFAGGLIGITYGGYGGLLWAIAVVIALCYVFGIIRG